MSTYCLYDEKTKTRTYFDDSGKDQLFVFSSDSEVITQKEVEERGEWMSRDEAKARWKMLMDGGAKRI